MENLGGLDEVKVKENKTEETVVSLEEKKAKRKPFHYWEVNSCQFRLKLKASTVTDVIKLVLYGCLKFRWLHHCSPPFQP